MNGLFRQLKQAEMIQLNRCPTMKEFFDWTGKPDHVIAVFVWHDLYFGECQESFTESDFTKARIENGRIVIPRHYGPGLQDEGQPFIRDVEFTLLQEIKV